MNLGKTAGIVIGSGVLVVGAVLALVIPAGRGPASATGSPGGPTAPAPSGRADRALAAPAAGSKAKAAQSQYLSALLRHEADRNWVEFGVLAFNEAERISAADRTTTLDMLTTHQSSGGFPALFCIARHHWFAGNKDEACRWFVRASVVYSVDAQRCTDPTSRQAVQAVKAHFAPLSEYLKQYDRQVERQWIQEALDFEQALADREPASWIAAHGLAAFKGKPAGSATTPGAFLPEEQWRSAREAERAAIAASLAK